MKSLILPLLLMLIAAGSTAAQTAIPTPRPPAADDDVVKISTSLIQIDVSVTNKKGEPIPDLRRDEVEIYENGRKQAISNFSFVSNVQATGGAKLAKDAVILPGTSPRPEAVRRTIAIVVDDLSLSFESAHFARGAVIKYVREQVQDGDLVAIIRTGAGVGALQQFTTDRRQLLAAAEKIKFNLSGASRIGIFNPIDASLAERMESEGAEDERQFQRENEEFRESIFAGGTLGALNYVVRGMQDLPGRKSIVLLSDGFRLYERDRNGLLSTSRMFDPLRRLIDFANRSAVVFYSIDTRGLQYTGLTAADSTSGLSVEQVDERLSERRSEISDTQDGLAYLARETGGFAVLNSNSIDQGINKALRDQSYYLVGYEPPDETFDPKTRRYNKLEVRVLRPGAVVRYRTGFFGISDEAIKKPVTTPEQAVMNALTSPFAVNDVSLRLTAMFAADAKKNAFLRGFLHVDPSGLSFQPTANGDYSSVFDLVAYSFGDSGVAADQITRRFTMTVKKEGYERIRKEGFVYQFNFPVKKPGGYQVRVALRDISSNKIGSANQFVEVPNVKKDRVVISGVVLEAFTAAQWAKVTADPNSYSEIKKHTDPMLATTLRQFRSGSVLRWAASAYNAARSKRPLSRQVKLYRDGKLVFESPVVALIQADAEADGSSSVRGVLQLGTTMAAGDYIMQIVIAPADEINKRKAVSQFTQFEIVK